MRASWFIRASVLVALVGSLAFTPVHVRVTAEVSVAGAAQEAVTAISTEILNRGGELITSPSGASWYVVKGISVSLAPRDNSIEIEASRMRGAGCSSKSLRRDEDQVFTALDQLIVEVSRKSGIPMHATRLKRPNQTPEPTTTLVTPRADARVAPSAVVAHL
jgi:hypothetical protein